MAAAANDEFYGRSYGMDTEVTLLDPCERLRREWAEAKDRDELFLLAWKHGANLAGPGFFGARNRAEVLDSRLVDELTPDVDEFKVAAPTMSLAEASFLGAMLSFYNSKKAQELLDLAGHRNISDLASALDDERRFVIATLFVSYQGW